MKKQILNLGKALNKTEQKLINGGGPPPPPPGLGPCGFLPGRVVPNETEENCIAASGIWFDNECWACAMSE